MDHENSEKMSEPNGSGARSRLLYNSAEEHNDRVSRECVLVGKSNVR